MTFIALREKSELALKALNQSVKEFNDKVQESLKYEQELKAFIESIKKV